MATPTDAPRRCLVTGGNGFIGSFLVEHLVAGRHEVRVLCRPTSDMKWLQGVEGRFEKRFGDITDPSSLEQAVEGCQWVFHLGGVTAAKSRARFLQVNGEGTANVFRAAQKTAAKSLQRFIYVSSLAAGGPCRVANGRITEADIPRPVSCYGESKLLGETRIRELAAADASRRWPFVIFRAPAVFGPRDKDVFKFFQALSRHIWPVLGFPAMRSNPVYVVDFVEAMLAASRVDEAAVDGETFYVANVECPTMPEILGLIKKVLGVGFTVPVPLFMTPMFLQSKLQDALNVLLGRPWNLAADKVLELWQRNWSCDVNKARQRFGWTARFSLESALKETADWYRLHKWL